MLRTWRLFTINTILCHNYTSLNILVTWVMHFNWSVNEMEATSLVARKKSRAAGPTFFKSCGFSSINILYKGFCWVSFVMCNLICNSISHKVLKISKNPFKHVYAFFHIELEFGSVDFWGAERVHVPSSFMYMSEYLKKTSRSKGER